MNVLHPWDSPLAKSLGQWGERIYIQQTYQGNRKRAWLEMQHSEFDPLFLLWCWTTKIANLKVSITPRAWRQWRHHRVRMSLMQKCHFTQTTNCRHYQPCQKHHCTWKVHLNLPYCRHLAIQHLHAQTLQTAARRVLPFPFLRMRRKTQQQHLPLALWVLLREQNMIFLATF